jgi:hypothetical protein
LFAVFVDDANGANAYLIVDAERSSYGVTPLETKNGAAEATPLVEPAGGSSSATGSPEGIR